MTWFRWWHAYIRMNSKPKPPAVAEKWTKNLSLLYVFFAWNAAGIALYNFSKLNVKDLTPEEREGLSPAQQIAIEKGKPDAKIIRIKGFSLEHLEQTPKQEQVVAQT